MLTPTTDTDMDMDMLPQYYHQAGLDLQSFHHLMLHLMHQPIQPMEPGLELIQHTTTGATGDTPELDIQEDMDGGDLSIIEKYSLTIILYFFIIKKRYLLKLFIIN